MDEKQTVTLIGPAKVGGQMRPVGAVVAVTDTERRHLEDAGALPPPDGSSQGDQTRVYTEAEFRANFDRMANEFDAVTEGLKAELEVAVARYEDAETRRDQALAHVDGQRAFVSELQGQVADLNSQLAMAHENLAQLSGRKTSPETSPDGPAGDETAGADPSEPQSGSVPADQNTPPTEKVAKTAPKKGAAATKA